MPDKSGIGGKTMQVVDPVSGILKGKGSQVWFISPSATVYEALELMAAKEVGALLVMEGDRIAGILSERDYARKVMLMGRSSKETEVSEIMAEAITVDPDCSVDIAMRTMTQKRVRHLPVLDRSGKVLGMISIGDLVKWVITSHEKTIEQLQSYISSGA
jgi:CBS domain-containing protein